MTTITRAAPELGDPRLPEGFWTRVQPQDNGCWIWTGAQKGRGYGESWDPFTKRKKRAHRFAYECLIGPIPNGLTLDHVVAWGCTSKLCVNPAHLEPVSNAENLLRRGGPDTPWRTHCPNGHEYTPENTRVSSRGRGCWICQRARVVRAQQKRQTKNAALEPKLTAFDKRVLAALAPWSDNFEPLEFRNAWQVAERMREYDVGAVRDTLRGLTHLGYAFSRRFDSRQEWVGTWRAAEFHSAARVHPTDARRAPHPDLPDAA